MSYGHLRLDERKAGNPAPTGESTSCSWLSDSLCAGDWFPGRSRRRFPFVNDRDVVRSRQEGLFAVVADGMGGMASGQEASAIAIASLADSFSSFDRNEALAPQLRQALCEASGKVFQRLNGLGGSTAIVCHIFREQLWFACVGDSSLYLLRDQQLNRLNQEHTVCTQRYEEALLSGSTDPSSAETIRNPMRLRLFWAGRN